MQKVFVLNPVSDTSIEEFQSLLDEGYEVKYITTTHPSIYDPSKLIDIGRGESNRYKDLVFSGSGRIVYILSK